MYVCEWEGSERSLCISSNFYSCNVFSCHHCGPQLLPNSASTFLYPISIKEIHYHVLTRTQMQREMQSSKCSCSHLPVQVITGILKISKEGNRAEKFRQLLSGQGRKAAVLKCTGGGQKTLSKAALEPWVKNPMPLWAYEYWAKQRKSIVHQQWF